MLTKVLINIAIVFVVLGLLVLFGGPITPGHRMVIAFLVGFFGMILQNYIETQGE